jgi:hypothetical protein
MPYAPLRRSEAVRSGNLGNGDELAIDSGGHRSERRFAVVGRECRHGELASYRLYPKSKEKHDASRRLKR